MDEFELKRRLLEGENSRRVEKFMPPIKEIKIERKLNPKVTPEMISLVKGWICTMLYRPKRSGIFCPRRM